MVHRTSSSALGYESIAMCAAEGQNACQARTCRFHQPSRALWRVRVMRQPEVVQLRQRKHPASSQHKRLCSWPAVNLLSPTAPCMHAAFFNSKDHNTAHGIKGQPACPCCRARLACEA